MKNNPDISVPDMIEEAMRELAMRQRHYPTWVRAGKMKQRDADQRIDRLQAIIRRLTRTAAL